MGWIKEGFLEKAAMEKEQHLNCWTSSRGKKERVVWIKVPG